MLWICSRNSTVVRTAAVCGEKKKIQLLSDGFKSDLRQLGQAAFRSCWWRALFHPTIVMYLRWFSWFLRSRLLQFWQLCSSPRRANDLEILTFKFPSTPPPKHSLSRLTHKKMQPFLSNENWEIIMWISEISMVCMYVCILENAVFSIFL